MQRIEEGDSETVAGGMSPRVGQHVHCSLCMKHISSRRENRAAVLKVVRGTGE